MNREYRCYMLVSWQYSIVCTCEINTHGKQNHSQQEIFKPSQQHNIPTPFKIAFNIQAVKKSEISMMHHGLINDKHTYRHT